MLALNAHLVSSRVDSYVDSIFQVLVAAVAVASTRNHVPMRVHSVSLYFAAALLLLGGHCRYVWRELNDGRRLPL